MHHLSIVGDGVGDREHRIVAAAMKPERMAGPHRRLAAADPGAAQRDRIGDALGRNAGQRKTLRDGAEQLQPLHDRLRRRHHRLDLQRIAHHHQTAGPLRQTKDGLRRRLTGLVDDRETEQVGPHGQAADAGERGRHHRGDRQQRLHRTPEGVPINPELTVENAAQHPETALEQRRIGAQHQGVESAGLQKKLSSRLLERLIHPAAAPVPPGAARRKHVRIGNREWRGAHQLRQRLLGVNDLGAQTRQGVSRRILGRRIAGRRIGFRPFGDLGAHGVEITHPPPDHLSLTGHFRNPVPGPFRTPRAASPKFWPASTAAATPTCGSSSMTAPPFMRDTGSSAISSSD